MDRALTLAAGKAFALVATLLQRGDLGAGDDFARLLGVLAIVTGETNPAQGEILAGWASIARDSAKEI